MNQSFTFELSAHGLNAEQAEQLRAALDAFLQTAPEIAEHTAYSCIGTLSATQEAEIARVALEIVQGDPE